MGKLPDKIFKEKLGDYQRSAPASAWDRIEGNMQSKHSFRQWWKYAAAILVLVIAGFIVYQNDSFNHAVTSGNDIVAGQPSNDPGVVQVPVQTPEIEKTENIQKYVDSVHVQRKPSVRKYSSNRQQIHAAPKEEVVTQTIVSKPDEDDILTASNDVKDAEKDAITEKTYATIVYSKEEVDNRFLQKTTVNKKARAKSDKKQTKTDIASATKSNNKETIGLGDLRQLKDEFFTFAFLAQNDKTQKSKIQ